MSLLDSRSKAILGLGRRAGRVAAGEAAAGKAVRTREALVVLLAGDAGQATRRYFRRLCREHGVPLLQAGTKEELGRAIGKSPRAVLAITGESFARALQQNVPVRESKE